jgi:hypothetical protein
MGYNRIASIPLGVSDAATQGCWRALKPQQPQDISRIIEIATKFRLEFLPPPSYLLL